ncbi:MAG TPA: hypothetical protein VEC38_05445 [Candidatus Binataceae bacterium]|nr:hypothetical protein [Candidatus Binataceae bacterium]
MITKGDDFPIHQTPEPVQQVFTSDRNFYDRYFFNGCWRDGDPYFAVGMGIYPNMGIMDAGFSAIVNGVQHCVRASRLLGADRMDTRVGPISIEVIRPLDALRVRVDHPEVKADLVFQRRLAPIEEPRFTRRTGPRITFDITRFTQHGAYSGTLTVGGRTFDAAPSRVWGVRDRSWGVRTVGAQDPAGAPSTTLPQFFWLWSPNNFEDVCTHFDVNENADGSRWHEFGGIAPAQPQAALEVASAVDWRIDFKPGTRHARRVEIDLRLPSGAEHHVELTPIYNFYMQGIGYTHPKWGHGLYVGPDESTYESFKLADVDESVPLYQHIEAVCRSRIGSREGMGVFEMLILGPHAKSGFKGLLDMHP